MRVRLDEASSEANVGSDKNLVVDHAHGYDGITVVAPNWTRNPFALEGDAQDLDDEHTVYTHTLDALTSTAGSGKQVILAGPKSKPRPAPVYKDKRVEEHWAFLKLHEGSQLPPPSRCPSLMSRGTLSSRNSSTRSTRSSIWDPLEEFETPAGGVSRFSASGDLSISSDGHRFSIPSTEQLFAATRCPVKTCDHHVKGFTRPMDRKRHILKHYSGVLECGFCDGVTFSQSSDRVNLFLTHLLKKHNAGGQRPMSYAGSEPSNTDSHDETNRSVATCTVCTEPFTAQGYYEHLSGCILREVARNEGTHANNEDHEDGEESGAADVLVALSIPLPSSQAPKVTPSVEDTEDPFEYSAYLSPAPLSVQDLADMEELTASSRCLSLTSSKAVESSDEETDWTEGQTSRESSPGASQVTRRLSPAKRRVVENIMQEFQRLFNESIRTHTSSGHSSSYSSGSAGGWSSNSSTYSASAFVSRKRSLSGSGAPPPDEDDSNKRRRPDNKDNGKKAASELRFACPYYKRNPGRHQTFTSCRDPGFTTVARLKEHLYRRHLLPPQCHRCCTTFTNDISLREHQRDPSGCSIREQVPLEGFDKDQERRLKSKKKSQTSLTEEEKWKTVYRVLFPDDGESDIPTPYIEYQPCTGQAAEKSNVVRFQEFSRLELPRLVRRTLEVVVEREAQPLEEKMKERLVDIVKECQGQLLAMFQTVSGGSAEGAPTPVGFPTSEGVEKFTAAEPERVATFDPNDMFLDFDGHLGGASSAPTEPHIYAPPALPKSSNSSDSGYDSTWPPSNVSGPSAPTSVDFDLSTAYADLQHVEFDDCFGILEEGQGSSSTLGADASDWAFVEGLSTACGPEQGVYEAQWHP